MTRLASFTLSSLAVALIGAGCIRVQSPSAPITPPSRIQQEMQKPVAQVFIQLGADAAAVVFRNGEERAAVSDAEVATGDRIKVARGPVSFIYPDAGETRLETGADVTLLTVDAPGKLFAELRLASGRIWTRFEKIFGSDEQFSVAANGVVATVRGTGFGVSALGKNVEVQVAERAVEVGLEADETGATLALLPSLTIVAGEGIALNKKQLAELDTSALKSLKRKVSDQEKFGAGYRFASQRLDVGRLRRPATPRRLFDRAASVTPELEGRQRSLRQMMLDRLSESGFVAPTRPVERREVAPGATPSQSFQGPSREGSTSTANKREVQIRFVKAVRAIKSSKYQELEGGLEIVLQDNSGRAFQTRNALTELRIGTLDVGLSGPSSGSWSNGVNEERVNFYLTPNQRAQLRGGEDVWVWYNSFESERYYFGKLDLRKLES